MFAPWKNNYGKTKQCIKKQRYHFANKYPYSQSYGFSNNYIQMWQLDHKEGWGLKNWCFWILMLEKTLQNPLDCKKIKPVNPKENQPWIFIGRTEAEAKTPILWPSDVNKEPIHWKRLWCWERLKSRREGDHRGWDGWMASPTRWAWVWANSGRWWYRETWHAAVHGVAESHMTEWLSNNNKHAHKILFSIQYLVTLWTVPIFKVLLQDRWCIKQTLLHDKGVS